MYLNVKDHIKVINTRRKLPENKFVTLEGLCECDPKVRSYLTIDKFNYVKIKRKIVTKKIIIIKVKRQMADWEKVFSTQVIKY